MERMLVFQVICGFSLAVLELNADFFFTFIAKAPNLI